MSGSRPTGQVGLGAETPDTCFGKDQSFHEGSYIYGS